MAPGDFAPWGQAGAATVLFSRQEPPQLVPFGVGQRGGTTRALHAPKRAQTGLNPCFPDNL